MMDEVCNPPRHPDIFLSLDSQRWREWLGRSQYLTEKMHKNGHPPETCASANAKTREAAPQPISASRDDNCQADG